MQPLALVQHQGRWHLYADENGTNKTFLLRRIVSQVTTLTKTFPEDKWGPDELFGTTPKFWPHTRVVPFHYPHPVTGEKWQG